MINPDKLICLIEDDIRDYNMIYEYCGHDKAYGAVKALEMLKAKIQIGVMIEKEPKPNKYEPKFEGEIEGIKGKLYGCGCKDGLLFCDAFAMSRDGKCIKCGEFYR